MSCSRSYFWSHYWLQTWLRGRRILKLENNFINVSCFNERLFHYRRLPIYRSQNPPGSHQKVQSWYISKLVEYSLLFLQIKSIRYVSMFSKSVCFCYSFYRRATYRYFCNFEKYIFRLIKNAETVSGSHILQFHGNFVRISNLQSFSAESCRFGS